MTDTRTVPSQTETAERVVRDALAECGDLPVRARFFRGFNHGNDWNPIREAGAATDTYDAGWHVNVYPGGYDAAVTSWGHPSILGPDKLAGQTVTYPTTGDGAIDEPTLRDLLVDAIRAQAAVVAAERAKVGG
jgi:hypothetical protein